MQIGAEVGSIDECSVWLKGFGSDKQNVLHIVSLPVSAIAVPSPTLR
jgi:hypothetical protein